MEQRSPKPKIALFAEYPAPIIYGGLEMQCLRTYQGLRHNKVDAELLDYYNPDQSFDLLHIFGNPPSMYEIVESAAKKKPVVFSAVFGGAQLSLVNSLVIKNTSRLLELLGQKIDHTRVYRMFEAASYIISLNAIERDFIQERYDIPPEKIGVIPVGVESAFFRAKPDQFIQKYQISDFVLFTGNLTERKNPLRLARALKRLKLPGVFIAKKTPTELDYADEFASVINQSSDLLWIEGLSNQDPLLASAYKASRIFCLPSFAEGQSASALEAMAAGKPLILADRPYSYIESFSDALRCDPTSEEDIAALVATAYKQPKKYARQLSSSYDWNVVTKEVAKIYEAVISRR